MKTRFIKAKGINGDFYINVNHIDIIYIWKGGNNTIHYQIQYKDFNQNNKLAEISEEDFKCLTITYIEVKNE